MKILFRFCFIALLFSIAVPGSLFAGDAGLALFEDFTHLAGSLKVAKDQGKLEVDEAVNSNSTDMLSVMLTGHERIIRAIDKNSLVPYAESADLMPEIREIIKGMIVGLEQVREINSKSSTLVEAIMRARGNEDADKATELVTELNIMMSKNVVVIEEVYQQLFFFVTVLSYGLMEEEGGVMVLKKQVDQDYLNNIRENVLFYYGDEAKQGLIAGQKHIDAVGGALWISLDNIEQEIKK